MFPTMLRKPKKTPKGRPILLDLPLKEDGQLRRFAREKGLTPTAAARLLIFDALMGRSETAPVLVASAS
jgi:hypothetical protein